ncbi:NAD-dependent epimerase/dehydratase family protein [Autumnicola edwardsiae]|uniref:NAD(P)-dependent oxidoreductase n=1 Tax=Autumnicola edwardsiae TaxID=3075594 RepID=A0ABU3CTT6_9FLAO|nr:NAD(P)-dependent oxidoreductase [Zunongwangia sp. F297]MDT0649778.1 NAD(P)-dependent oxidoreductase [Zunongwangia sp. F297]
MKIRTAVIGANGFLGSCIVKNLLKENYEVLGVYNNKQDNLTDNCINIPIVDFLSAKHSVDNIIFAAGNFKLTAKQNNDLNFNVLYKITNLYPDCRFIYVSSANVYGQTREVRTESSPYDNPNLYGLANISGEFIASSIKNHAVVRPVYLYGPNLNNNSFLPKIIGQAKEGAIKLLGQGLRRQDYLHVNDAAKLCIKAMQNGNRKVFLGATCNSIANKEIANVIRKYILCEIQYLNKDEHASSLYYDSSWTQKELNWEPQISLEEGIKEMFS